MKQRTSPRLAWSLWGIAMVFTGLAVVFLILGLSAPTPPGTFGFRGFSIIFAVAFGTVGALIASRQPENPIGWILCAAGVTAGFQELANQYAIYALDTRHGELPLGELGAWFPAWIWIPATGTTMFFLALFPNGHLLSPGWKWVLVIGTVGTVIAAFALAILPGPLENFSTVDNPFGMGNRDLVLGVGETGQIVYGVAIMLAALSVAIRFRRSGGEEHQQLKWLAFSGVFLALALFASFLGGTSRPGPSTAVPLLVALLVIAGFASLPIAIGIAILRYRLYDIDVVINKTVVYGLLAAFITAVYVGIVVGVGALAGSTNNALLSAVAAAVVALLFQPIRRGAQHFANRLVYGKRATPYEVLSALSDQLAETYSLEEVLPRTARLIVESTGVERAQILLGAGSAMRVVATFPENGEGATGGSRTFPVRHQGEEMGAVAVRTPPNEPLTPAQEKLVSDLASQAGLVLRNVALIEDLRASRQRLVAAQDEERRRLERNLHDGAQQQLIALSVKMRLVDTLVDKDPAKAHEALDQVQAEATDAIETLRDLARGIYPPLLADKGLAAALEAQARKSAVPVTVEANGMGRYTQETEAAVYFCCLEALQNIAKYANASRATITLSHEGEILSFTVEDDGMGFDPAATPKGSGLQNMTDRLEALGGGIEVSSSAGAGTRVEGRLPTGGRQ